MATVEKTRTNATLTLDNGKRCCVQLRELDDFFNGVVQEGKEILLILQRMRVAQGAFVSFENPMDGEYLVYIRPAGSDACHVYHIESLIAYAYVP